MALSVGTATANAGSPPTVTGSGMSFSLSAAIYSAMSTLAQSQMTGGGFAGGVSTTLSNAVLLTIAQSAVAIGTGIATGLVPYVTSNASVVVAGTVTAHVTSESLGRTPNPNNPNTAIVAPSAPVDIPLTGIGSIL